VARCVSLWKNAGGARTYVFRMRRCSRILKGLLHRQQGPCAAAVEAGDTVVMTAHWAMTGGLDGPAPFDRRAHAPRL
jgi:hypothetical protein